MTHKLKDLTSEEMIAQLEEWKDDIDCKRLEFSTQCHEMCIQITDAILAIKSLLDDIKFEKQCIDDDGDDSRRKVDYNERHRTWEFEKMGKPT